MNNGHVSTRRAQQLMRESPIFGSGETTQFSEDEDHPSYQASHRGVLNHFGYTKLMRNVYGRRSTSLASDHTHVVHVYPNNVWSHTSSSGAAGHGKTHKDLADHLTKMHPDIKS